MLKTAPRQPQVTSIEDDSPSFSQPPVVEAALAVQFDEGAVDLLSVGAFRKTILSDFPKHAEYPSRPPMEEVFDVVAEQMPFRVEVLGTAPMPRVWLLNEEGSRLVQVQHDLIAINWRYLPEGSPYPRFRGLRDELRELLARLEEVVTEEGGRTLRPNWCEVTYINHITSDGERPRLDQLLTVVAPPQPDRFLPPLEDGQLIARYRITDDAEASPIGRLTANVSSALRNVDRVPIWVLTLTGRVRSSGEGLDEAMDALDKGHDWALQGFLDLTTPKMQSQWGLKKRKRG